MAFAPPSPLPSPPAGGRGKAGRQFFFLAVLAAARGLASPEPTPVSAPAALEDTRWNVSFVGKTAFPPARKRPPFLLLRPSEGRRLLGGWTGCHGIKGTYDTFAGRLRLAANPSSGKPCPSANATREQKLLDALRATAGYRIQERSLELLGTDGKPLACFAAAPPP